MTNISHILLEQLKLLEPNEEFTGFPPKVRSSSGKVYFVKCGTSAEQEQYLGEVESLKAIEAAAPGLSPNVLSSGVDNGNQPFFISEYKDLRRLGDTTAKVLATRLATELHAHTSGRGYGFQVPTYCGVTRLGNGWFHTWEKCYSTMIGELVNRLREQGSYKDLCDLVDEVRERLVQP
ncbi:hypothetical protein H0H92_000191 [Tricholoma furcatifolium]|nr:hypothetical protein H0H92_000191 [Tricholoma furcatifolium]